MSNGPAGTFHNLVLLTSILQGKEQKKIDVIERETVLKSYYCSFTGHIIVFT